MEDDYPCVVDGAPASIGVNLRFEHAPPATHDTRYTLAILMREGGDQGLGTAAEVAALDLVEEALMPRAFALGLTYVGRLRTRGVWEVTFYGPRNHLTTLRAHATELAGDRQIAAIMNPEAAWTYYRELLLPDPERRQWLEDRRLVEQLAEDGDPLSTPRRVEHRLALPAGTRDQFISLAIAAGFTVNVDELILRVHRRDPVELEHIHAVVMILVAAATPLGGRYESWESGRIAE